jgi:F-type H+/Na+-transporting ATPase subunit alpha
LNRGQRIQEILKQPQYQPLSLDKQVMSLYAVTNGYLENVPVPQVKNWERDMHAFMDANHSEIGQSIMHSKQLDNNMIDSLRLALEDFNRTWNPAS